MTSELLARVAGYSFYLGVGTALLLLLLEGWWPEVARRTALGRRWLANLSVLLVTVVLLRWLPMLSVFGAALVATDRGWGLFNQVAAPGWVATLVGLLAVDLSAYAIHLIEHRSTLLWRIHRLHHSDPDVDVTTTYRFHPLEVVLRAAAQVAVIFALGVPAIAIAGYLALSAVTSALSHANVRLPVAVDRALRWFVITPRMHRVHHSIERVDYDSNFSVCLSCWDRLFSTYRDAPLRGDANVVTGVSDRTVEEATSVWRWIMDPFLGISAADAAEQDLTAQARRPTSVP